MMIVLGKFRVGSIFLPSLAITHALIFLVTVYVFCWVGYVEIFGMRVVSLNVGVNPP